VNLIECLSQKYSFDLSQKSPIQLPLTRNDLTKIFKELGFKTGVEIGVQEGIYSEIICQNNPEVSLFCVDPWKAYRRYRDFVSQERLDKFYETAKKRLEPYNCTFIKKFSLDAAKDFADKSLDFGYIDGNHEFRYVVDDTDEWIRKIKKGGIMAGHDYKRSKGDAPYHVVDAISAYTYSHKVKPWFITTETDHDLPRSFFWEKQWI